MGVAMPILPVVLSGGSGTRLWPLSREKYPKQLLPLVDDLSMLQSTVARLDGLGGLAQPLLICNEEHRFAVAEQVRVLGKQGTVLLEPVGRNTAPAMTLAALWARPHPPRRRSARRMRASLTACASGRAARSRRRSASRSSRSPKKKPSIDLEINFDYNSATIGAKALPQVTALGQALSSGDLKGRTSSLPVIPTQKAAIPTIRLCPSSAPMRSSASCRRNMRSTPAVWWRSATARPS